MIMAIENTDLGSYNSLELKYFFKDSLSFQSLSEVPEKKSQICLLNQEVSFLYSTQLLAEENGEMALEHMRGKTYEPTKQNKILDMQLKDEVEHVRLLKKVVNKVGLDPHANAFAKGYMQILYSAQTLAEKVFVFQIMTESVSLAYLNWRLGKIQNSEINGIDHEILADEVRHLKMGKSVLQMCDPEEVRSVLTKDRRHELIREMSNMCANHFYVGIRKIIGNVGLGASFKKSTTDLDRIVARTILAETKTVSELIQGA